MTPGQPPTGSATNRHYDQNPELFRLFLDRRMKYTSGLYRHAAQSLDEAQEAKLRYVAALLRLQGGERVLDIGSGWGSMVLFLAEEFGCEVTAVTPSPRQAGFIRDRAAQANVADRVHVEVSAFEDAALPECGFSAVTAIGVLEHLADRGGAIARMRSLLEPRGRMYVSSSCYRSEADKAEYEDRPASRHAVEIYGYTAMPTLSELVRAVESAGLSISSVTDLTANYRRTIADWQARMAQNRHLMDDLAPGFADELGRYFETANASWGYTAKHYALTAVRSRMGELRLPA